MKRTRKPAFFLLALLMALLLAVPVFAAGNEYAIVIDNGSEGHIYEAYQIFAGDLSGEGILSNVVWGDSVNSGGLLAAL